MIASWLSTVRVIRRLSSAAAAIRISSPTAMPKIFNPIGKRMAPPPSGTQPVAGMGRPARYVADYSGTALLSAGYFIRHFPDTEVAAREADLLPVGYFHVVFTLPAEISPACVAGGLRRRGPGAGERQSREHRRARRASRRSGRRNIPRPADGSGESGAAFRQGLSRGEERAALSRRHRVHDHPRHVDRQPSLHRWER